MADKSTIEWTDASWTPIRARNLKTGKVGWHCEHATTGCEFCYAEGMNKRLGTGLPFKPGHRADIEIFLDKEMLSAPIRWKKPRMIFVCSMTDLFADFIKDEWIDSVFAVMALCSQHTFQVLTKRAERMRSYLTEPNLGVRIGGKLMKAARGNIGAEIICIDLAHKLSVERGSLPNVWLGVSCERQKEADERIPFLLDVPAAVRFISAEPLIEPISLLCPGCQTSSDSHHIACKHKGRAPIAGLDWVIVGGESGPGARPFHIEWADALVDQCKEAGAKCFVKQFGSMPMSDGYPLELKDRKGGDEKEWPNRLNIREFPENSDANHLRV